MFEELWVVVFRNECLYQDFGPSTMSSPLAILLVHLIDYDGHQNYYDYHYKNNIDSWVTSKNKCELIIKHTHASLILACL